MSDDKTEALRGMCKAMEYWANCRNNERFEMVYKEISRKGGAYAADAYKKAMAVLIDCDPPTEIEMIAAANMMNYIRAEKSLKPLNMCDFPKKDIQHWVGLARVALNAQESLDDTKTAQ